MTGRFQAVEVTAIFLGKHHEVAGLTAEGLLKLGQLTHHGIHTKGEDRMWILENFLLKQQSHH